MYLPDAYGSDDGGPDDGAAGEHEPVRDPRGAEPPPHVRLRRQEADRALHRSLLERELRPDFPDPEPAGRRRARRATPGEATRQARPPCLLAHCEGPRRARALAGRPRAARAFPQRAPAQALPRGRRAGGRQHRPDRALSGSPTGAPRDLRGYRATPRRGVGRSSAAALLAGDPSLRPAPVPRDAPVVRGVAP